MKLSDTQRAILEAAARRADRMIQPPPSPPAPRAQIARKFLEHGLAEACTSAPGFNRFLWGGNVASGLRITDAGVRAIGIEPAATDVEEDEQSAAAIARRNAERLAAEAAAAPVAPTAPTGAEEDAPRGEDAKAPEAAQAAPTRAQRGNLRDAAAAVLATWDDDASRATDIVAALDGPMQALRAMLAGKPERAPRDPATPRKPREGTKQETVLALLRREEGATIAQIVDATGWQQHTVRGFFAGLKKRQGITVIAAERIRQVGPNRDGAKGTYSIYRVAD
jgi:pyruvate/2-oxoglutarate dehydrogenase complex dihydrolipoamide acyltransferase (E2) component